LRWLPRRKGRRGREKRRVGGGTPSGREERENWRCGRREREGERSEKPEEGWKGEEEEKKTKNNLAVDSWTYVRKRSISDPLVDFKECVEILQKPAYAMFSSKTFQ
jgi:hypothetical protein